MAMKGKGRKAEIDEVAKLVEDSLSPKVLKAIREEVRRSVPVEPKQSAPQDHEQGYEIYDHAEKQISRLRAHVDALEKRLDALEQYSRRNCLLLHGLQENHNENAILICRVIQWTEPTASTKKKKVGIAH
ncbi:hypothetical protein J437_LFUL004170 [Ladona fulva]|uniref:Uncharacterized protein n=1 Tax=Ladona fulva TaxID=123851 RepID=A0A8K0JZN6_LADFU|nr:hypothetical protein J437_LFUL004170 [Ladona fulva]